MSSPWIMTPRPVDQVVMPRPLTYRGGGGGGGGALATPTAAYLLTILPPRYSYALRFFGADLSSALRRRRSSCSHQAHAPGSLAFTPANGDLIAMAKRVSLPSPNADDASLRQTGGDTSSHARCHQDMAGIPW